MILIKSQTIGRTAQCAFGKGWSDHFIQITGIIRTNIGFEKQVFNRLNFTKTFPKVLKRLALFHLARYCMCKGLFLSE